MTAQLHCVGTPGKSPRLFVTCEDTVAAAQVKAGEIAFVPASIPPAPHAISSDGTSIVAVAVPLATVQASAWAAAKSYRETYMAGGCRAPKGLVQTDAPSQRKIDSAARQALLWKTQRQISLVSSVLAALAPLIGTISVGPSWSIDWTMADNSIVTHSADDTLALADAVTTFVTNCQIASRAVRTKIFAATTAAAVAAIDITAGYPASS